VRHGESSEWWANGGRGGTSLQAIACTAFAEASLGTWLGVSVAPGRPHRLAIFSHASGMPTVVDATNGSWN